MKRLPKFWLGVVLICAIVSISVALLITRDFAVLNPQGTIAQQQRDLMVIATVLMLIVVIPVFVMTFFIVWKYREGNSKARYEPEWDSSKLAESIWWGFPLLIIAILSVITFITSHSLDPFKPIANGKAPVRIQVVALQWKWLFMYPDHGIATVNYLQIPEDRPINFEITADAPMNSLWIPQLGGQIYAMAGMSTKLHLVAENQGTYYGSSANLSGRGFAGMKFQTHAVSEQQFTDWVQELQTSEMQLDFTQYVQLAKPSVKVDAHSYALTDDSIYKSVMSKYVHNHAYNTGGDAEPGEKKDHHENH